MNPQLKWQRQTAESAYREILPILSGRRRLRDIAAAVDRLHASVNEIQLGLLDRNRAEGGVDPACCAGCDHCCVIRVRTTVPEIVRIAIWLLEEKSPEELAVLSNALANHCERLDRLAGESYFETPIECPLLQNHLCSVHAARAVPCRAYLSWNADACFDHFRMRKPSEIPVMASMSEMIYPVAQGIAEATRASGAGPSWVSLPHALLVALRPGSLREWQSGAEIFLPAIARELPEATSQSYK